MVSSLGLVPPSNPGFPFLWPRHFLLMLEASAMGCEWAMRPSVLGPGPVRKYWGVQPGCALAPFLQQLTGVGGELALTENPACAWPCDHVRMASFSPFYR